METKPPIRFRKLRITWSVGWGLGAVLLCALWVRSYWWCDNPMTSGKPSYYGISLRGMIEFCSSDLEVRSDDGSRWKLYSHDLEQESVESLAYGFHIENNGWGGYSAIPHWFAVMLLVGLAAASWFHWRFSLRTLLIVTTLLAVLLGLLVYIGRK